MSALYRMRAWDSGTAGWVYWTTQDPAATPASGATTPNYTGSLSAKSIVRRASEAEDAKDSVRAATTAALPAHTATATTLTADANGALPAQDGVTLAVGQSLLVKNEGAGEVHGPYVLTQPGDAGTPWILTRRSDADTSDKLTRGTMIVVDEGTQAGLYVMSAAAEIVLGTTAQTWTKIGTASGSAGGQLGGTYPNPDVRGLRETSGPTLLTLGALADGEYLRRSGGNLVGGTPTAIGESLEFFTEDTDAITWAPFFVKGACYIEQVKKIVVTVANNHLYEITVNGTTVSYTSDGSATMGEVLLGLETAVNGNSTLRPLVQLWHGSGNDLYLTDRDPRTATTSSAGANLAMTTHRSQASYDHMSSAVGSGTYPPTGTTFWWDLRQAIALYWQETLGFPADLLPVGRYELRSVAGYAGSGALHVASPSAFADAGGSASYDGFLVLPQISAGTEYVSFHTVTNSLGMIRAFKAGGAVNQQLRLRGFVIGRLPY